MKYNNYRLSNIRNTPNQFSSNYFSNQSNNDYDLQKRIEKSLYPYNSSNMNSQYKTSTINNVSDYNYNSNNSLIEDFKETLRKTQQLTNELLSKNNFFKGNYNINYKYNSNLNSDSKTSDEELDSDINTEESEENEEEENSFNNEKELNINNKQKINNINNNLSPLKKEREEKLKSSNQLLKNSNDKIKNENRILEVEITNYKSQENKKKKNILTNFDENLLTFITSLKQSLKETTKKNSEIVEKIFEYQKSIEDIINKSKKLSEEQKKLAEKIEINNRKKAEIQIMNEENEKKINNLEEEKGILNEEIEKLKLELNNLKGIANNLKILNDSNLKKKQDNKELITKLNNTIKVWIMKKINICKKMLI